MKKRMIVLMALVLSLVLVGQAFGYGGWSTEAKRKTLAVSAGLWAALSSSVEYDNGMTAETVYADYSWLVMFDAKLYFYESNLGVGVDAILLDSATVTSPGGSYQDWQGNTVVYSGGEYTLTQWLMDFDVYYRLPVIPKLNAFGAVGLTYFVFNSGGAPGYRDSSAKTGFNVKLGGEYFIDDDISVSAIWSWHTFNQGALGTGDTTFNNENSSVKLASFMVQASLYL